VKRTLRWTAALALSGGGLWFALRGADLPAVGAAIRGMAAPQWLLIFPLANFLEFVARTWRWKLLLDPLGSAASGRALFPTVAGAFFLNNVLPFRAGEAARVYWTARKTGLPWTSCLSALVVDRVFDLMSLLTLVAFVLARKSHVFPSAAPVALFAAGTLGLLAALAALARFPDFFRRAVDRPAAPEKLRRWTAQFIDGSRALRRPAVFLAAYAVSLAFWSMNALLIGMTCRLFGIGVGFTDAVWIEIGICAGVALPSAPGYVGTFEAAGVAALAALGHDRNIALPMLLVLHAAYIVNTALIGLPALWLGRLRARPPAPSPEPARAAT
jgi:glycosyltransferase 2 family protein